MPGVPRVSIRRRSIATFTLPPDHSSRRQICGVNSVQPQNSGRWRRSRPTFRESYSRADRLPCGRVVGCTGAVAAGTTLLSREADMFRSGGRRGAGQDAVEEVSRVLALAQQTADQAIADAQDEAAQIIARAHMEAEQIIADAKSRTEHT